MLKRVSKSVDSQRAAAAAVFLDFCRSQALDPVEDVEHAVIAIGAQRMAVLDGHALPDWVRCSMTIDPGAPISSDEVLGALKVLRDEGINALIGAIVVCRKGGGRRVDKSILLELYKMAFEAAFRAALAAVRSPLAN